MFNNNLKQNKIKREKNLKIGMINVGTLDDKQNKHEISKKECIKTIFEEDDNLDMILCNENNITEFKDAKILGYPN